MDTKAPWKPGDVVQLRSGGPKMVIDTVEWSQIDNVWVISTVWADANGIIQHGQFKDFLLQSGEPVTAAATAAGVTTTGSGAARRGRQG